MENIMWTTEKRKKSDWVIFEELNHDIDIITTETAPKKYKFGNYEML